VNTMNKTRYMQKGINIFLMIAGLKNCHWYLTVACMVGIRNKSIFIVYPKYSTKLLALCPLKIQSNSTA